MSVIDFTALSFASAVPMPVNAGGVRMPANGAQSFRVDRMGARWAFDFQTVDMAIEPEGRRWQALFGAADRLGGLFRVRQPGFDPGGPGTPVVSADTAAGREVPVSGLSANYTIRLGQWLSFVVGGQRYLDRVTEQAIADADGEATVKIQNLLRAPLTEGDVVELGVPKIEGSIVMRQAPGWGQDRMTSFAFTVTEDA